MSEEFMCLISIWWEDMSPGFTREFRSNAMTRVSTRVADQISTIDEDNHYYWTITPDQYWRKFIPEIPPVPGNSAQEELEAEVTNLRSELTTQKAFHDDEVAALKSHIAALRESNGKVTGELEILREANKGLEDQVAELTNQVIDRSDQDDDAVPPSERELMSMSQRYGVQDTYP